MNFFYSRLDELNVYDVEFLHGCNAYPTLILIHQDINGRHIKVKPYVASNPARSQYYFFFLCKMKSWVYRKKCTNLDSFHLRN